MSRIEECFKRIDREGGRALMPFITAGYPRLSMLEDVVVALEDAGADMIEIGIPFSDPLADGPIIQYANHNALQQGVNPPAVLEKISSFRDRVNMPVLLLVYFNTMLSYGVDDFLYYCKTAGVDGLIIPDISMEDREDIFMSAKDMGVDIVPMVAPTSRERIGKLVEMGSGFVYCVSSTGVTGPRGNFDESILDFLKEVKFQSRIPTAVGFGINNKSQIIYLKPHCDGIIIGSALVKKMIDCENSPKLIGNIKEYMSNMRAALDR